MTSKLLITATQSSKGKTRIADITECTCVYIEAGKLRLAVMYDPIKKCMTLRSSTGHPLAIVLESNNSFHVRSL